MVAFRKSFFAVAAILMIASMAMAQTTPPSLNNVCFAYTLQAGPGGQSSSTQPLNFIWQVRVEGFAEPADIIYITCPDRTKDAAGNVVTPAPVGVVNGNVYLTVSANITNKINASNVIQNLSLRNSTNTADPWIQSAANAAGVGVLPAGFGLPVTGTAATLVNNNQIVFSGVNIPATGTAFQIGIAATVDGQTAPAITNERLRVDATGGQTITAVATGKDPLSTRIFFTSQTMGIAAPQQGVKFEKAGDPTPGTQCDSAELTAFVKASELFEGAFIDPTGVVRATITVTGLPSKAKLYGIRRVTGNVTASLVPDASAIGAGGTIAVVDADNAAGSKAQVTGNTVTYQFTADTLSSLDSISLPVVITYAGADQVDLGTISAKAQLSIVDTTNVASATAPIPRFGTNQSPSIDLFKIAACRSVLLFPYVTNQAGFDTGIALVNTSLDNLGDAQANVATKSSGTCKVNFYAQKTVPTGTTIVEPNTQVVGPIAAGDTVAFALSQGSFTGASFVNRTTGAAVTASPVTAAGFQGYVIADCNFQYAHGYAFISDIGVRNVAHGYVALVLSTGPVNSARGGKSETVAW